MINNDELLILRNLVKSSDGKLLDLYLSYCITDLSKTRIEASEIKGMCMLLDRFRSIPSDTENKIR